MPKVDYLCQRLYIYAKGYIFMPKAIYLCQRLYIYAKGGLFSLNSSYNLFIVIKSMGVL